MRGGVPVQRKNEAGRHPARAPGVQSRRPLSGTTAGWPAPPAMHTNATIDLLSECRQPLIGHFEGGQV